MPRLSTEARSSLRIAFFETLFEVNEGVLCLATTARLSPKASFKQTFFDWPKDVMKVENFVLKAEKDHNVYFCVNLLSHRERKKNRALPTDVLWADLDDVNPKDLKIPPPITIESSPGRWQALWKLSTPLPPLQAEEYSKRLAYSSGADKSGWDLTQLLRVPFTKNFKYENSPEVQLVTLLDTKAPPLVFESLPSTVEKPEIELPKDLPIAEQVIYKYTASLRKTAFTSIYSQEPDASNDWSSILWRLLHILFEAGMSAEEVFVVSQTAPCNKYARDGRPIEHLWNDILKAQKAQEQIFLITGDFKPLTMPWLVEEEETTGTFIDVYRDWAVEATDAVPGFHDLACTIMLSAIVANSVRLETSNGITVPNLWGLILGDSTLTRKTTAMRMAMDFLLTLDSEMIVATDGSPEGLLTGLESRPNRTSLFFKDEISGFFDSINKREYLSGMPETLTHLYDVPGIYTRALRKGTIRLESPVFIFFGGGVASRVYDTVTDHYVLSGFLPRFLVVSGENPLEKLRRTGPPTDSNTSKKAAIGTFIADVYENYAVEVIQKIGGQPLKMPPRVYSELTQKAWDKYGEIEETMVKQASESSIPDLALPTFERMSRSILKMSMVLAATRQTPKAGKHISVTHNDVINAAWYVQDWGRFSVELVSNAGKKSSEKLLDKILKVIEEHPGILRSTVMQHYHLNKKEADDIFATLEDRMLIRKEVQGRGFRFYAA